MFLLEDMAPVPSAAWPTQCEQVPNTDLYVTAQQTEARSPSSNVSWQHSQIRSVLRGCLAVPQQPPVPKQLTCTNGALSTLLDAASLGLQSVGFSPPCLCSPLPVWLRV